MVDDLGTEIKRMERQREITDEICTVMLKYLDNLDVPIGLPNSTTLGEFKEHLRRNTAELISDIMAAHALSIVAFMRSTTKLDTEAAVKSFVKCYTADLLTMFSMARNTKDD